MEVNGASESFDELAVEASSWMIGQDLEQQVLTNDCFFFSKILSIYSFPRHMDSRVPNRSRYWKTLRDRTYILLAPFHGSYFIQLLMALSFLDILKARRPIASTLILDVPFKSIFVGQPGRKLGLRVSYIHLSFIIGTGVSVEENTQDD